MIIESNDVNRVLADIEGTKVFVIGNNMVNLENYVDFLIFPSLESKKRFICRYCRKSLRKTKPKRISKKIADEIDELIPKYIRPDDIMASINYHLDLAYGIGTTDDIDHLGNRRLRCVGELLQNQFRIGLSRMERVVRERMTIQDLDVVTPQSLINIRPFRLP